MSKLPSDFPGIDLAAWNAALPMPESRPLALRRNAQPVLDVSDYEIVERAFAAAKPGDPFHVRGLRRRK